MLFKEFTRGPMRSLIAVQRDLPRQPTLALERPTEKRFCRRDISFGAEQKIDSLSLLVDGAIEISPATLDLDVGLIDAPGSARLASEAIPPLFKFRNIALDPTHDCRMSQRYSAFGHHFHEIPKAELEPEIPSDAEDDDLPVEMAAFEKSIYAQHPGPGPREATWPRICPACAVCTRATKSREIRVA